MHAQAISYLRDKIDINLMPKNNFWDLKQGDNLTIAKKKSKVVKLESFRLPKAKQDSARWAFLKLRKKDCVIYMVNKNGRKSYSLEEISIDKPKKQWWRNYTAVKKLKF